MKVQTPNGNKIKGYINKINNKFIIEIWDEGAYEYLITATNIKLIGKSPCLGIINDPPSRT